jgi:hypothetical protein
MTALYPTTIVRPGRELVAGWAGALAEIAAGGARARLRIAPGRAMVAGRVPRARITVPGLRVAGLELAVVDVSASDLSLAPGWPVRLRAQHVAVRVRVEQAALDRWMRATGLPVRLVLRDGEIRARAGVGGLRLGEVAFALRLEGRQLRLVSRRASLLGASVVTMPPVPLPLPPLPRGASLVAVDPTDRAVGLSLEVTDVDEPVTTRGVRWAIGALRAAQRPSGR